jgi:polyisoprenoid-binding protein YceI
MTGSVRLPVLALLLVLTLAPSAAVEAPVVDAGGQPAVFVTAATGNEARYRVREQLAGVPFPSDAVGTTASISGRLVLDGAGRVDPSSSRFEIDLTSLRSDSDRRDNYVRRRTLETEQYPTAVFVPRELRGLAWPLPSGEAAFTLVGDLTVHGRTRPSTWTVEARFDGDVVTGTARTSFRFGDFEMDIPRVAAVLSVTDEIRLEYDFRLERERAD